MIGVYRTAWAWLIHCYTCAQLVGIETTRGGADKFIAEHPTDPNHVVALFAEEVGQL